MDLEAYAWESVRLAAQAITALVVARLAVRWALSRFKQEKLWERRLSAQVEIIVALTEMRRLYGRWIDELETHRSAHEETDREHRDRYRSAARQVEEAMSLARLLLPPETSEILRKLEQDRENLYTGDQYEDYSRHYGLLDGAISELVRRGREMLP